MDLGIKGRKAIVCAASKGLGKGCALALAREGVELTIAARGRDALEATAEEIRKATGAKVTAVAADVTTEAGRAALLAACPSPDILVNNAGGPPSGELQSFGLDDWRKALEGNMLAPIALIQATVDAMVARGFGRIVNITSGSVKAPLANLDLSNGARAGLTGAVAQLARKVAARNVTINGLLPGTHDTDRIAEVDNAVAKKRGVSFEDAKRTRLAVIPAGRYGTAEEFGAVCAFLCSVHTGFITGQNILLDGGQNPSSP